MYAEWRVVVPRWVESGLLSEGWMDFGRLPHFPAISGWAVIHQRPAVTGIILAVSRRYRLDPRNRPDLLFAMMRIFASEKSRISFEGHLASTELFRLDGGSHEEEGILRREGTSWPQLDFIVLPLAPPRVPEIEKAIRSKVAFSGYRGIVHVQIESAGEIVFGAYDSFHKDCVAVNAIVTTSVLDDLVKSRVLKGYGWWPTRGTGGEVPITH